MTLGVFLWTVPNIPCALGQWSGLELFGQPIWWISNSVISDSRTRNGRRQWWDEFGRISSYCSHNLTFNYNITESQKNANWTINDGYM